MKKIIYILLIMSIMCGRINANPVEINAIQQRVDNVGTRLLNFNRIPKRIIFTFDKEGKADWLSKYKALKRRQIIVYGEQYQFIQSDDEIAAMLAREIATVMKSYSGMWGGTIDAIQVALSSKKFETVADKRAVDYMVRGKGFIKIIPFLVGIVVGYVSAVLLGLVDFQPVLDAAFFSLPNFIIPFVNYIPNFGAILTIAPIALVTMAEHIGDHTALSAITGKDLLKDPGLDKTLLGDGLATFVAGMLGGPANTTYGENTSVVGMTKIASVWVIGLAAIFAIILGFLGKFTALVSTIPACVLGGVSLLLYGFISVNGLKVLIQNQIDFGKTKNIVVASTMLVLGLGGAAISFSSGDFSITISGMSLAAIIGILINLLLPEEKTETKETEKSKN